MKEFTVPNVAQKTKSENQSMGLTLKRSLIGLLRAALEMEA